MKVVITAANEIRLNRKEAGLGEGMEIVKPGDKRDVSDATARELFAYKQAEPAR